MEHPLIDLLEALFNLAHQGIVFRTHDLFMVSSYHVKDASVVCDRLLQPSSDGVLVIYVDAKGPCSDFNCSIALTRKGLQQLT